MPHPYSLNESASSSIFKDPPDTEECPACMSKWLTAYATPIQFERVCLVLNLQRSSRYRGIPSMHVKMIDSICHTHTVWTSLPRPQPSKILQIPRNAQHACRNDWQHMPHPYSLNESASSSTFKDPPDTQECPACMSKWLTAYATPIQFERVCLVLNLQRSSR